MERVAFLVEDTNTRLSCMLNPESIVFRRLAGIDVAAAKGGSLAGRGMPTGAALFNGGGYTELDLDLVFDVSLRLGSSITSQDVRDHTGPIWRLAESTTKGAEAARRPAYFRFVWGKTWNIRAVIRSASERLENFDSSGRPRRSWVRMRLMLVPNDLSDRERASARSMTRHLSIKDAREASRDPSEIRIHTTAPPGGKDGSISADRIDALAEKYYGNPGLWRLIAKANNLPHPETLPPGIPLKIPEPRGPR